MGPTPSPDAVQRHRPASERKYLLTFRGTRSPKSDAMRIFLPTLHNGRDIVLTCACRWFNKNSDSAYDRACQRDETEFQKYTCVAWGGRPGLWVAADVWLARAGTRRWQWTPSSP